MIISGYILSIVGVIILGVIVELMLVEGQMQKYIKNIFVIFVIFVIISPIPNLINTKVDVSISNPPKIELDENLLKSVNKQKASGLESSIILHFSNNGISGVSVKVSYDENKSDFVPTKIYLSIQNLVIKGNYLNINKYEVLTKLVLEVVKIEKENIEFYE